MFYVSNLYDGTKPINPIMELFMLLIYMMYMHATYEASWCISCEYVCVYI